jgi:hypothetical protein
MLGVLSVRRLDSSRVGSRPHPPYSPHHPRHPRPHPHPHPPPRPHPRRSLSLSSSLPSPMCSFSVIRPPPQPTLNTLNTTKPLSVLGIIANPPAGIPASWCGLYSLKPSSGRIPTSGLKDPLPGQEAVKNTVGPLCSSLGGVEAWCRAVVGCEPWREGDPGCLPIPWREVEVPEKLFFGECGAAQQHIGTTALARGRMAPATASFPLPLRCYRAT